MDPRALAELILMTSVGLTMITVAVGLTTRLFLAPVLRDVVERFAASKNRENESLLLERRLDHLEDRLASLESGVDRIAAAQEFDRRLGTAGSSADESA